MEIIEGETCTVQPFNDSMKAMKNIQTVNVAYAYDTEEGEVYILRVNHTLDFTSTMENSILCTNQARSNGIIIDDVPKLFDMKGDSTQAATFPENNTSIPIEFHGPVPFLPIRYPTAEELSTCKHLELTSDEMWDPTNIGVSAISTTFYQNMNPDSLHLFNALERQIIVSGYKTTPHGDLTPELLSKYWNISLPAAKRTLEVTTSDHIRLSRARGGRRVKTMAHQRQYKQMTGYLSKFCSDTFKSNVTSIRGNNYFQLFCNRGSFITGTPIKTKSQAPETLDIFLHDVGIPSEIMTDGAKELHKGEWGKKCKRHTIHQKMTEPKSPWQNPAEMYGGILKRKIKTRMRETATPIRIWDYSWEYEANLYSLTASGNPVLDGVTGFEKVHGYTPNISEYLNFQWYDWVWFTDGTSSDNLRIGRWCGPAHTCSQGFAYHVLTDKGNMITRSSVFPMTNDEMTSPALTKRREEFTTSMEAVIGNHCTATINHRDMENPNDDPYQSLFDKDNLPDEDEKVIDPEGVYVDSPAMENSDNILGLAVQLPHG